MTTPRIPGASVARRPGSAGTLAFAFIHYRGLFSARFREIFRERREERASGWTRRQNNWGSPTLAINYRDLAYAQLDELLGGDLVPERPGRQGPRAVKRRPRPYPLLTAPRRSYKEIRHRNRYRRPGNDTDSSGA